MKIYLVGGAVRDIAMGLSPKDFDYVAVGGNPDYFQEWKMVGKDFPVFIEPAHGWEVALARKESKTGLGYTGFSIEWEGVTLEEDLARRDLTINAMAQEVDWEQTVEKGYPITTGDIIDPYGGLDSLKNRLLHPTSVRFEEDPVRLLRAGRFLARYTEFKPSVQLIEVCKRMARQGTMGELNAARVWKETEKALTEHFPVNYFDFITQFDFPFVRFLRAMKHTREDNAYHREESVYDHTMMVLAHASQTDNNPRLNFACLMHDIAKPYCYATQGNGHGHEEVGVGMVKEFCSTWSIPKAYRDSAIAVTRYHQMVHSALGRNGDSPLRPRSVMTLFNGIHAFNQPDNLEFLLQACFADHYGRIGDEPPAVYRNSEFLKECYAAASQVDAQALAARLIEKGNCAGHVIGERINEARCKAISVVRNQWV